MKELPVRKNQRLQHFDYSTDGAYFLTLCTKNKRNFLGKVLNISDGEAAVALSRSGKTIDNAIKNIEAVYKSVSIDKYVIMPNHIHIILIIDNDGYITPAPKISTIVGQFKGYVSKQIGNSIWQTAFYDHVIRGEKDYNRIWQYIDDNPLKWADDEYYTKN